jgi:hypothetical protein
MPMCVASHEGGCEIVSFSGPRFGLKEVRLPKCDADIDSDRTGWGIPENTPLSRLHDFGFASCSGQTPLVSRFVEKDAKGKGKASYVRTGP